MSTLFRLSTLGYLYANFQDAYKSHERLIAQYGSNLMWSLLQAVVMLWTLVVFVTDVRLCSLVKLCGPYIIADALYGQADPRSVPGVGKSPASSRAKASHSGDP